MKRNWIIILRHTLLITALAMISSEGIAQLTMDRKVLASSGNTAESGTLEVEWTVGEAFVQQLASGSLDVSEGFHQGGKQTASYLAPQINHEYWKLYPQPAHQFLRIQYEASPEQSYDLHLFDLLGRQCYQVPLGLGRGLKVQEISLGGWNPGFYLVQITDESQQVVFQQKWIKE